MRVFAQSRSLSTDVGEEQPTRSMQEVGRSLLRVVDELTAPQLQKAAGILGIPEELLERGDGKPLQPVR